MKLLRTMANPPKKTSNSRKRYCKLTKLVPGGGGGDQRDCYASQPYSLRFGGKVLKLFQFWNFQFCVIQINARNSFFLKITQSTLSKCPRKISKPYCIFILFVWDSFSCIWLESTTRFHNLLYKFLLTRSS